MTTAKKSPATKTATKKAPAKKAAKKTSNKGNPCWPGFEPAPGKTPGTKGSCEPKPGKQSTPVKKADQKAAAASKLQKQGK